MLAVGTLTCPPADPVFSAALSAASFNHPTPTPARGVAGEPTMWEWGTSHFMQDWFGINLPWFSLINTTILVLSSITCQIGVFRAEKGYVSRTGSIFNPASWGMREWYILTFIMGAFFIGGQAYEYFLLTSEGFLLQTNAYTSAVYPATRFPQPRRHIILAPALAGHV